jgi:hypothetical protein
VNVGEFIRVVNCAARGIISPAGLMRLSGYGGLPGMMPIYWNCVPSYSHAEVEAARISNPINAVCRYCPALAPRPLALIVIAPVLPFVNVRM